MTEIVIGIDTWRSMSAAFSVGIESGAALYLTYNAAGDKFLMREFETAGAADLLQSSSVDITFSPLFLIRATRRAKEQGMHLAILHTHPDGSDAFSIVDDATERGLAHFIESRISDATAFSMIVCQGKIRARIFGKSEAVQVRVVGPEVVLQQPTDIGFEERDRYDRQVRAFGPRGQAILQDLSVAIVGLGGTGSLAAQQLAHLGVSSFILIDPDQIEETNLNRVVGAHLGSVGAQKTDVASSLIRSICPDAEISIRSVTVISEEGKDAACGADFIMICTDSHSSRAFLSELSYQYLIPAIDVGVSINSVAGNINAITGRTQMLAPGLPCLLCSNALNSQTIREELMTPEQRASDPYFSEKGVRQPAVISINGTMVSLAITMFLSAFTGIPSRARWQTYDAITGVVRALNIKPDAGCPICGNSGVIGNGDLRNLSFLPESA